MRRRRKRSRKIESMIRKVEQMGGLVGISDDSPDWVVERFLQEILHCPECQDQARRKKISLQH